MQKSLVPIGIASRSKHCTAVLQSFMLLNLKSKHKVRIIIKQDDSFNNNNSRNNKNKFDSFITLIKTSLIVLIIIQEIIQMFTLLSICLKIVCNC